MPWIISIFGVAIKVLAVYAVARVLLALGLSYVIYTGFDILINNMQAEIENNYGAMTAGVFEIVTMMGADVAISILFSAIAVRLVINGVVGGVSKGLKWGNISSGV